MATQATVVLNTKNYSPGGANGSLAHWVERSGGVGSSFSTLDEKYRDPTGKDAVTRIEFDLAFPIVATTDDACACIGTVLRNYTAHLSVWVPATSTLAERTDFLTRIQNLTASAPFVNAVENLDSTF